MHQDWLLTCGDIRGKKTNLSPVRKHSRLYLSTTSQNQTKTQSLSWELSGAVLWPQPSLSEVKVKVNYRPVGAVDGERLITHNVALRCWRGSWYHIWLWCEPANVWAKDRGFRILWASVHHRLLFKLQVLLSLPVPLPSPPVPLPSFCTLFHLFNCIYYNSSLTVSKFSASSHLHLPSYFSSPNWVTCSSFSHYPEIQCSDRLCRDADEQSSVRADVAPFPHLFPCKFPATAHCISVLGILLRDLSSQIQQNVGKEK